MKKLKIQKRTNTVYSIIPISMFVTALIINIWSHFEDYKIWIAYLYGMINMGLWINSLTSWGKESED